MTLDLITPLGQPDAECLNLIADDDNDLDAPPRSAGRSPADAPPYADAPCERPGAEHLAALEEGRLVHLNPEWLAPSQLEARDPTALQTAEFRMLEASIVSLGVLHPVLVELSDGGGNEDGQRGSAAPRLRVVAGELRRQVCLRHGLPVPTLLCTNADRVELLRKFFGENLGRVDMAPIEAGRLYKAELDRGTFSSQVQLAKALGVNRSSVQRAVKLASLPSDVIDAFSTPLVLQYRDADILSQALQKNAEAVLAEARRIAAEPERPPREQVLRRLRMAASQLPSIVPPATRQYPIRRGEIVVGQLIGRRDGRVTVRIDEALTPDQMAALATAVQLWFEQDMPCPQP